MKKFLATMLTLAMVLSTFAFPMSANAEEGYTIWKTITPTESLSYESKSFSFTEEDKTVVLDFDFKASTTDHIYRMMFRDDDATKPDGTEDYADFGHVYLDHNGYVIVSTTGQTPYNLETGTVFTGSIGFKSAAQYEAGKWHKMTLVFKQAGADSTIDYYMDNQHLVTSNMNMFSTSEQHGRILTGRLSRMFVASTKTGLSMKDGESLTYDGNEQLEIANLSARCVDDETFSVENTSYENGKLTIEFSDALDSRNDLGGISVKAIDGTAVAVESAAIEDNKLIIPATGVKEGTYYVYTKEALKGINTKALDSNVMSFAIEQEDLSVDMVGATKVQDFNSATDGGYVTGMGYSTVPSKTYVTVDEEHGKSWYITDGETDPTELKYIRYTAFDDSAYMYSDKIEVSADFNFKTLKRTANISLINGSSNRMFGYYFFDSYGNFAVLNGTGDSWSTEDKESEYSSKHTVAYDAIETNKWYTVRAIIDKAAWTVDYYLGSKDANGVYNETYVGTAKCLATRENMEANGGVYFKEFRLTGWEKNVKVGDVTTKYRPFGDFYLDNVKVSYIKQEDSFVDMMPVAKHGFDGDVTDSAFFVEDLITAKETVDTAHGISAHIDGEAANNHIRFKAFDEALYQYNDEIILSADYYLNTLSRTANISLMSSTGNEGWTNLNGTGGLYGMSFFDSYGNFVVLDGDNWSGADAVTYTGVHKVVASGLQDKTWYTVESIIDQPNFKVTYNIYSQKADGTRDQLLGTYTATTKASEQEKILGLEKGNHFGEYRVNQSSSKHIGDFYVDNIKVGYNKGVDATNRKTLIVNTSGNITEDNSNAANVLSKLSDKYIVDFDFTVKEAPAEGGQFNITARTNDAEHKPSGIIFAVTQDGSLQISKALLNWYNATYMVDTGIDVAVNEPVNIKILVDKTKTKAFSIFVDDQYVKSVSAGWGTENASYATDNPGALNIYYLDVDSDKMPVTKAKIGNVSSNSPIDVTAKDSQGNEYNLFVNDLVADLASINIKYANALTAEAVTAGKYTLTNADASTVALTPSYDAENNAVVLAPEKTLANGTYTISATGITGADDYTATFTVNDTRTLEIVDFKFVDKELDDYNTIDITKPICVQVTGNNYAPARELTVIISEYTNEAVPRLLQTNYQKITANGNFANVDDMVSLTPQSTTSKFKAFIWNGFDEITPMIEFIQFPAAN